MLQAQEHYANAPSLVEALRRINRMLALRKITFPVGCFVDEAHEVVGGEKAMAAATTTR